MHACVGAVQILGQDRPNRPGSHFQLECFCEVLERRSDDSTAALAAADKAALALPSLWLPGGGRREEAHIWQSVWL